MTDHEHTPPTEAELADWKWRRFELNGAPLMQDAWDRLIREVRRLRAERGADSERDAYVREGGIITTNEDGDLALVVDLQLFGLSSGAKWLAGECGLTQEEADEVNGDGKRGYVDGAAALARIIDASRLSPTLFRNRRDAARQEPTP